MSDEATSEGRIVWGSSGTKEAYRGKEYAAGFIGVVGIDDASLVLQSYLQAQLPFPELRNYQILFTHKPSLHSDSGDEHRSFTVHLVNTSGGGHMNELELKFLKSMSNSLTNEIKTARESAK